MYVVRIYLVRFYFVYVKKWMLCVNSYSFDYGIFFDCFVLFGID